LDIGLAVKRCNAKLGVVLAGIGMPATKNQNDNVSYCHEVFKQKKGPTSTLAGRGEKSIRVQVITAASTLKKVGIASDL
jgi:hypothetical protein